MTGSKQVRQIFCGERKKKRKKISRKFAGISRKFAGISRKLADRCFNQFKTNMSSICGHGPRILRPRPLYPLCPKNQFPETMVPRPKTERGLTRLWVPKFGKIIYRIFSILPQFLYYIAISKTKMVHRVFFLHLGFAG